MKDILYIYTSNKIGEESMSISCSNLYSSYSSQTLQKLYSGTMADLAATNSAYSSTSSSESIVSVLSGIEGGFNIGSIFDTSSGIQNTSSSFGSCTSRSNIDDTVLRHSASVPTSSNPYTNGSFGLNIIDNFFGSISTVRTGGDAPSSVLEQRLNFYLPADQQINGAGKMYGNTSNFFNVDSVAYNTTSDSSYNTSSTKSTSNNLKKALSGSLSDFTSFLA